MARRRRSPVLRNLLRATLGAAVAVALLAVICVGAAILLIDPNNHKPEIIAAVRRVTGRELFLNGPIHIGFGLPPTLVADDIALANAPGGSRPNMLTLRRMEAKVALLPLLAGELDVVRLDLIAPDLLLETDASGHRNWRFTPEQQAPSPAGSAPGTATGGRFALQAVRVRDGRVSWLDGATGQRGSVELPRLDAEGGGPDASLVIAGEAVSGGRSLTVTGETGSITRLLDPHATSPWPVQIIAQNEATRLALRGSLLHPLRASGYALQVDATATDLAAIAPFLPQTITPPHDLSLSAQLSDAGNAPPAVTAMALHVGGVTWPGPPDGVRIVRADLTAAAMNRPLHADVEATFAGAPLHLLATIGSLAALLPDAAPAGAVPLELTIEAGGATLTAKGSIVSPSPLTGLDAVVSARIPDLAALSGLAGQPLPGWRQIAFAGHVAGGAGVIALRQAALSMPQAQLTADLDIGTGARPSLRGAVQASRIDLDGLIAGLAAREQQTSASTPATTGTPAAAPARQHVISDEPFDFGVLDRQDGDLQMTIAALQTGGVGYGGITGHLMLQNGHLTLDPFDGETPGGRLAAKLSIDSRAAEPPVAVSLHAPAIAMQPFAAALGDAQALSGTASIDAELHGAGRSPHALAASLDGHLGVSLADGEVSNALLESVLGAVLKAAKLPEGTTASAGTTKLHCLALRLDASRGVVTVNTLVADATRLLVQGGGTIDLGQETLALRLRPMLRAGPGIVVPVRVGGGFREPKLGPDFGGKGGLLGSLAAIAAGDHGGDACVPALAAVRGPDASTAAPAAPPQAAPPPAQPKPPKPIDVLRGLLH